ASKPRKKTLSKRATARPVARALSPFPGSPRLRRRQRRLLDQEFAQRPDARRLSFVGSAQKVIAERRSDAGREWRNEAAGGEFVGGDGERGQRHTLPLGRGGIASAIPTSSFLNQKSVLFLPIHRKPNRSMFDRQGEARENFLIWMSP